MTVPTRVALALGSGGARGYAHIGAIQVLEERGYEIVTVAGSSMGSLVGGLWAAGRLDEYTDWALSLTQLDMFRLLDPSLSAPGAIRAEKIFARVRDLLGDIRIEDLPVPFTAVATDLLARKEVWFQTGSLEVAIRASVAIPSFITPVMLNGRLLADGGMMNPVPIAPTAATFSDLCIAISLGGEHRAAAEGPDREAAEERPTEEWSDRFKLRASTILEAEVVRSVLGRIGADIDRFRHDGQRISPSGEMIDGGDDEADPYGDLPAGLSKLDVMNLSLEAMQTVVSRYRMAGYPPDVLVEVPKDACRSLDFHKAPDMIDLGRTLTVAALDRAFPPRPDVAEDQAV